ncbi:MAG: group II intron reverse transcriptase/maturase [Gemmatimonadaceae bacterium]
MTERSSSETVSTKLERIAKLAKQMPGVVLTTLAHHIDRAWLYEAYRRTRKDGAAGVDGQTAAEYAADLEENLQTLLDRAKSGDRYRAPPVRRAYIPKGDGKKMRPIGIPAFEDKVLQRAVAMVLEAVYEQDFLDCSYGFRPRRSAHQALRAVWKQAMDLGSCWVLEADIEDFFGSVDLAQMREILHQRVQDGVLLRLIGKWLKAGVMEEGHVYRPESGVPQGGVISPILSNVYLHEVLDQWFTNEVKPRLRGRAYLTRFADDFVMVFESEEDARRVQEVLPKRFGKYGLRLHPDKTRLVRFAPPPSGPPSPETETQRGRSFDLLGFTLYWGRSRKGRWVVMQKTARDRLRRSLRRVDTWSREHRHDAVKEQRVALNRKMQGHYAYYGVTGNFPSLSRYFDEVKRIWKKWLSRRNNRGLDWERMNAILKAFPLSRPRIVHSVLRSAVNP